MAEDRRTHLKIHFKLDKDEDGYPPDDWEGIWAQEVAPGLYRIDNIPFFVRGISCDDIVSASVEGDELEFKELVQPSGNSVLRIIAVDKSGVGKLREQLRQMQCESELSDIPGFLSVEVPAIVNIDPILNFLAAGEEEGRWEYEEGSIRHPHP